MTRAWATAMVVAALLTSLAAGVAAGYAGRLIHRAITSPVPITRALGMFVAASLAVLLLTAAAGGLRVAFTRALPILASLAIVGGIAAVASGIGTGVALLATVGLFIAVAAILAVATLARLVAGGVGVVFFLVVAVSGALSGAALEGGLTSTAIAIAAMVAGRRALHGATGFPRLVRLASAFAVRGGTRFRGADLRGARLTGAHLTACDFRGARLEGARMDEAELTLSLFDGAPPAAPKKKRWRPAWRAPART